jgi:hypothetical protein
MRVLVKLKSYELLELATRSPVSGIDSVGTVCVVSAIVEFITRRIDL